MQINVTKSDYFKAVESNDMKLLNDLLSNQVNPNIINKSMQTPLDVAICLNRWDMVKVLSHNLAKVYTPHLSNRYEMI